MKRTLALYCLCLVTFASVGWVSLGASQAFASQVQYIPLAPIDVDGSEFKTGVPCPAPDCFPKYLRTIYNVGIALAGLFAVVSIVRGGFELMFTDSILGRSEGKAIILRALGGLVIVYSSYILMNTINPALGRDLDLALQFPRITIQQEPGLLTIVTAADVAAQRKKQMDDGLAERQALKEEAAKKQALADAATDLATKAALLKEAIDLVAKANLMGKMEAPSDQVLGVKENVIGVLWDPLFDAKYVIDYGFGQPLPLGAASKDQRIAEANRLLLEDMGNAQEKINALSAAGQDTTKLQNQLNEEKAYLTNEIRYYKNGCDRTGLLTKTFSTGGQGLPVTQTVPCPP